MHQSQNDIKTDKRTTEVRKVRIKLQEQVIHMGDDQDIKKEVCRVTFTL